MALTSNTSLLPPNPCPKPNSSSLPHNPSPPNPDPLNPSQPSTPPTPPRPHINNNGSHRGHHGCRDHNGYNYEVGCGQLEEKDGVVAAEVPGPGMQVSEDRQQWQRQRLGEEVEQYPDDEDNGGGEVIIGGGGSEMDGVGRLSMWPSSRIVRVSRASGGKDRHSKVLTSKGLRDRRVRLSVTTAIQFYDLQDHKLADFVSQD